MKTTIINKKQTEKASREIEAGGSVLDAMLKTMGVKKEETYPCDECGEETPESELTEIGFYFFCPDCAEETE